MQSYNALITATATVYGLDPWLVMALAYKESSLHADAFRYEPGFWERYLKNNPAYAEAIPRRVSSSYGLMQVMFPTAVEHGHAGEPEELFVPATNLRFGCAILKSLLAWAEDDETKALGAYNAGKGNATSSTAKAYATDVLNIRRKLSA